MSSLKDAEDLKRSLEKEQAESWIKQYPDKPVDAEGNPTSDRTTAELGVRHIAGGDHERQIDKVESLQERMGGEKEDWIKLAAPGGDGKEVHAFKNKETGEVSFNRELHDIGAHAEERRAVEAAKKDGTAEDHSEEPPSDELEDFDANAADIAGDEPTEPPGDELEEFGENAADITDNDLTEPPSDELEDFGDNATEITGSEPEPPSDELEDFEDNAVEITGSEIPETPPEPPTTEADTFIENTTDVTTDTSINDQPAIDSDDNNDY